MLGTNTTRTLPGQPGLLCAGRQPSKRGICPPQPCSSFLSKPNLVSSTLAVWHAVHALRRSHSMPAFPLWQLEEVLSAAEPRLSEEDDSQLSEAHLPLRPLHGSAQNPGEQHHHHPDPSLAAQALAAVHGHSRSSSSHDQRQGNQNPACTDPACSCIAAVGAAAEGLGPGQKAQILQQLHLSLLGALQCGVGGPEPMDLGERDRCR